MFLGFSEVENQVAGNFACAAITPDDAGDARALRGPVRSSLRSSKHPHLSKVVPVRIKEPLSSPPPPLPPPRLHMPGVRDSELAYLFKIIIKLSPPPTPLNGTARTVAEMLVQ